MKPPDVARRGLVLQWLDKAAADFDAAEQLCAKDAVTISLQPYCGGG
jgi:hypothetical protein